MQTESRALTWFAFNAQLIAVFVSHRLSDSQSESIARTVPTRARLITTIKSVKNFRLVLFGDANTLVND